MYALKTASEIDMQCHRVIAELCVPIPANPVPVELGLVPVPVPVDLGLVQTLPQLIPRATIPELHIFGHLIWLFG